MKYAMTWHFTVSDSDTDELVDAERLGEHVQDVMSNLLDYETANPDISDTAIGIDATLGHVEIELVVVAETLNDAMLAGNAAIGNAIHAAGGVTPGWMSVVGTGHVEYEVIDVRTASIAA
jgi:hypothetical protein